MFDLIKEHLDEIIDKLYDGKTELIAMGNHEFKRHHVYKVINDDSISVLKLYYKKKRKYQELLNYELLNQSKLEMPRLLRHGTININYHEFEWMEISYLEGDLLSHVMYSIEESEICEIYKSIGEFVGKVHNIPIPEGSLEKFEKQDIVIDIVKELEKGIDYVLEQKLDEEKLILEAIQLTKELLSKVDLTNKKLIHNDLNCRNVIVDNNDGKYTFKGVIDFETGRIGHPYSDLLKLYHVDFEINTSFKNSFFEGYSKYQSVGKGFEEQMDIMLLYLGVSIASWAKKQAPKYYYDGIELIKKQMEKLS